MILQALKEYYDRKAADPDSGIAPEGWEKKEIPFLAVLDGDGRFLQFEDTRSLRGKKLRARSFLVPSLGEAKGNGIKANLFWENIEYMFGIPANADRNITRVADQHAEFKRRIQVIQGHCPVLDTVIRFLDNIPREAIQASPLWKEVKETNQALLLAIAGHGPVTSDPALVELLTQLLRPVGAEGVCLVTGGQDVMTTLEPPIKGVYGANPTGGHLVAVNNKITASGNSGATPAFASLMKEQGGNSPIGKRASFAYTTALNTLLGKDSSQRMQVGEASTVFWSDKQTDFEDQFAALFAEPPKDNPNHHIQAVRALLEAPKTGAAPGDDGSGATFYVLGLSPNASRIAIRFWFKAPLSEMQEQIRQHFRDLAIIHGPMEKPVQSLFRLLLTTATLGKADNIPPNLEGDMMRAIMEGLPYPTSIFQAAIRRIKAERDIPSIRAALVKACISRRARFGKHNPQEELSVSLDTANPSIGYRLGRLFAVLEKIQEEANPGIKATIRDRNYAAASSSPVTVFGRLMTLKNHHLSKLDSPGRRINLERLIGEIVLDIRDFPAHLNLDEQGRFAIGYYHQRQDLFTKKEKQD